MIAASTAASAEVRKAQAGAQGSAQQISAACIAMSIFAGLWAITLRRSAAWGSKLPWRWHAWPGWTACRQQGETSRTEQMGQTGSLASRLPRLDQGEVRSTGATHLSSTVVQVQHTAAGCRQTHVPNALE